jgi:dienelactone hydrolase
VASAGFTVLLPSLFGKDGKPFSPLYALEMMAKTCIRREFAAFEANKSGKIADYLRDLCRVAHARCGGPGVGALGMCFTGNFALALAVDPAVIAPVLCQPSLPAALTAALTAEMRAGLHLSPAELAVVKKRIKTEDLSVLGVRFTHDVMCPKARFDRLRSELGAGFEAIEIDSGPGNAHGIPRIAHSVVTIDLVDREGHPTRQALERIIGYFQEKLLPAV